MNMRRKSKARGGAPSPFKKYAECMEEIKKRTEVISRFMNGQLHALYVHTTAECVCLQLRKILELIALASMAANKEEYEKHRRNFHRDWHGGRILNELEKINPAFYPQPSRQIVDEATGTVVSSVPIETGFLTKREYKDLYNRCGSILHAKNPFSRSEQDIQSFLNRVPEAMDKILLLLNHHEVQLVDDDRRLCVLMNAESDGRVHVSEFLRVEGELTRQLDTMTPEQRRLEIGRLNAENRRSCK